MKKVSISVSPKEVPAGASFKGSKKSIGKGSKGAGTMGSKK